MFPTIPVSVIENPSKQTNSHFFVSFEPKQERTRMSKAINRTTATRLVILSDPRKPTTNRFYFVYYVDPVRLLRFDRSMRGIPTVITVKSEDLPDRREVPNPNDGFFRGLG